MQTPQKHLASQTNQTVLGQQQTRTGALAQAELAASQVQADSKQGLGLSAEVLEQSLLARGQNLLPRC